MPFAFVISYANHSYMNLVYFTNDRVKKVAKDKYKGDTMKGWIDCVCQEFDLNPEQLKDVFDKFDYYRNKTHELAEKCLQYALQEVLLQLPKLHKPLMYINRGNG